MTEHPVASAAFQPGARIAHYRIVRVLGQGGMATVFEAINERIEKRIAIKVLHPHFGQDPGLRRRFLNEARSVNLVRHPGIVDIYEFGETEDDLAYIVMEYLDGTPLHLYLQRGGRIAIFRALSLGQQIASALAAAHAKGIVHRDLKPANIVVVHDPAVTGGERAKLVDFGIAKLADFGVAKLALASDAETGTRPGLILGTPQYMAPEQCRSVHEVTDRADVYSLGIALYQMLAGKLPFQGDPIRTMMKHLTEEPPRLREANPLLPSELEALVHAMIAKDPAERPAMAEVEASIRHLITLVTESVVLLAGHPPLGAPPVRPHEGGAAEDISLTAIDLDQRAPVAAPPRRWRRVALLASVSLSAAMLLGGVLLGASGRLGQQAAVASVGPLHRGGAQEVERAPVDQAAPPTADLGAPDQPAPGEAARLGVTEAPRPASPPRSSGRPVARVTPLRREPAAAPLPEEMTNRQIELLTKQETP